MISRNLSPVSAITTKCKSFMKLSFHYRSTTIPMLHAKVHSEELKIKKRDYGLIILMGIGKDVPISDKFSSLTKRDIYRLAGTLLKSIMVLQERNLLFCNFRPENIYQVGSEFVVINP